MDPIEQFKAKQRALWAGAAPLEALTTVTAAELLRFAAPAAGAKLLDVGCGTGVVAITAARAGAVVSGLDLAAQLLERARANAVIAGVEIDWREGDVEALPFPDAAFDVVVSQFGHMFAPRAGVAIAEMLRVLRPGGTVAFSTWPPELFVGRMLALPARYAPTPLPAGVEPPIRWGDPEVVRERLGGAVKDLVFDRAVLTHPALSPQHVRQSFEQNLGPLSRTVEALKAEPAKLAALRRELEELAATYSEGNVLRQGYLLTRAIKI